jgi:hypothetical protein
MCPYCGRRVDPNDNGVTYGVAQVDTPGFGELADIADGTGGFFHPGCPMGAVGYVPRTLPGADLTRP